MIESKWSSSVSAKMSQSAQKPRTQEQRREASERKMLKAAISLFARQGYLKTTLTDVGKEAGYTAGLVSHKFGSKEGLLRAVVHHISNSFLADQLSDAIQRTSARESISNYIEIYIKEVTLREGPMRALYVIMGEAIGAVPEIRPAIADLNTAARQRVMEMIQRGIDQGEFREGTDTEAAAALIIGSLRGLVMQYLIDPKKLDLKSLCATVQATVIMSLKG